MGPERRALSGADAAQPPSAEESVLEGGSTFPLPPAARTVPQAQPVQERTCHSLPGSRAGSGAASVRAAQPREAQTQLPTCCSTCTAPASAKRWGGGCGAGISPPSSPVPAASADVLNREITESSRFGGGLGMGKDREASFGSLRHLFCVLSLPRQPWADVFPY